MTGKIEHILFDLGNVLVRVDREVAYRKLIPHLSPQMAELCAGDMASFEALFHEPCTALETGRIDFSEFHKSMCPILGVSLTEDVFHSMWCDMFQMDEAMVALGEELAGSYNTWLASNTSRAHYDWIIGRFPRVAFFKAAALSYELGVMKPSRSYYDKMMQRFGIDPDRAVFVDDLSDNVAGAEQCGIKGIRFVGRASLVHELELLGVRVSDA